MIFLDLESDKEAMCKKYVKRLSKALDQAIKEELEGKAGFLKKVEQGLFTNRYELEDGRLKSIKSSYHFLALLNIAARWAQLEINSNRD